MTTDRQSPSGELPQDTINVSDRFVEPLDHPCCGPVGLFSEGAQFLFALDRNIEIQIDRITNFLGEGFAPNPCPARKLLLLIRIQMNDAVVMSCAYIAPIS